MAGVRRKPNKKSGKYQAWFVNHAGKRKFFVGTQRKSETLKIAQDLEAEHRQVRLGVKPPPTSAAKHRNRPFLEAAQEYLHWGKLQGGTGGRPWAAAHAARKEGYLLKWQETLNIETLGDLDGILPRVEAALREMAEQDLSGNTLTHRKAALASFCNWAVLRGYLTDNPLKNLASIDRTPKSKRRALTPEEFHRLLRVAPTWRRLLYETALVTGLRVAELRALSREHLDEGNCGLWLEAQWTKNRKAGFQPLPSKLVKRLAEFANSGVVQALCRRFTGTLTCPDNPLLIVPSHPVRYLDEDLQAARVAKHNADGKLDFHSLRTSFVTFAVEAGASFKEAQTLARHSNPQLTANVYARTRDERLAQLAENIGERVFSGEKCAKSVHSQPVPSGELEGKAFSEKDLEPIQEKRGLCRWDTGPAIVPHEGSVLQIYGQSSCSSHVLAT